MAGFHVLTWLSALLLFLTVSAAPIEQSDASLERRALVPSLTGGQNVMGPGTYPRANFLHDGSILGVYTAFANGVTTITTARSTNGGVNWSQVGVVTSGQTSTHDIDNPYVLQLASGRILCAFRNHDKTSSGTYTYFRITICYSDDNGVTWNYLSTPASDPGSVNGNWEPFLRISNSGTLQLYYSRENNAADQDSLMRTSTDGGASWTSATVITGATSTASRDGMLGVATVSGNNLIAVFETETNGGQFTINSVTSSNDGASWGNRQVVFVPSQGAAGGHAPQVVNVGGTLVVSVMTDEDSVGNFAAKVLTSNNGGASWGNKLTFLPAVSNWPGLLTLSSTTLLGMADHSGAKAQVITLH